LIYGERVLSADTQRAWPSNVTPDLVRSILGAVRGLRYGSVEITVHDGRVVQVERREKYRIEGVPAVAGKAAAYDGEQSPGVQKRPAVTPRKKTTGGAVA
jgi:hypothetical protein